MEKDKAQRKGVSREGGCKGLREASLRGNVSKDLLYYVKKHDYRKKKKKTKPTYNRKHPLCILTEGGRGEFRIETWEML